MAAPRAYTVPGIVSSIDPTIPIMPLVAKKIAQNCFEKLLFRTQANGIAAEYLAATGCVGAEEADETADSVE